MPSHANRLRVILADDEQLILIVLKHYIDWEGLSLELIGCAQNGKDLLTMVVDTLPDIVITDINMPGQSGLEAIEEIHHVSPTTQFVIISAYSNFENARKAMQLGVKDFIPKPIERETINMALKQLIDNQPPTTNLIKEDSLIVRQAKYFIHKHYAQTVTLDSVAAQVYVSPNYLSVLFKKETGINFVDYVTQVRVEEAQILLNDPSMDIRAIGSRVGIDDARYFSRIFKKHTGQTPSDYRAGKANKNGAF